MQRIHRSNRLSFAELTGSSNGSLWFAAAAVPAAGAGFAAGLEVGLPAANAVLAWVREYMVPAFIELYASGIPFCG